MQQIPFCDLLARQATRTSHSRAVVPRRDRGTAVRARLDVVEVRLVSLPRSQLGVEEVVFFVIEPVAAAGSRGQENRSQLIARPVNDAGKRGRGKTGAAHNSPAP